MTDPPSALQRELEEGERAVNAPSQDLPAALRAVLRDGEEMVWHGAARPGRVFRLHLFGAGFGLILGGVPLWAAFLHDGPILLGGGMAPVHDRMGKILAALPFVAVGLAFFVTPWILRSRARRTIWALTTSRVLAVTEGHRGPTPRAAFWHEIERVDLLPRPDGSGDLFFHHRTERGETDAPWEAFLGVPQVSQVRAELLRRIPSPPRMEPAA